VLAPQNEAVPAAETEEGDTKKAGLPSLQEWLKRHGWVDKRTESNTVPQQSETPYDQCQLEPTGDRLTETNPLQRGLDKARSRIAELEAKAHQVKTLRDQVCSLQEERLIWQRRANEAQKALAETERHLSEAHRVIDSLMPLNVWAGNPCCVCGEPTDGVVDRETAAKLLERTGHKECLLKAGLRRRKHFFDLIGGVKIQRATVLADEPKRPKGIMIVP
jgi:DNA repair exonuclease SbcCD ATPase subunit